MTLFQQFHHGCVRHCPEPQVYFIHAVFHVFPLYSYSERLADMSYLCGDIRYRSSRFEYETCMLTTTNTIQEVGIITIGLLQLMWWPEMSRALKDTKYLVMIIFLFHKFRVFTLQTDHWCTCLLRYLYSNTYPTP